MEVNVEITTCVRPKGTRRIQFQTKEGELSVTGSGVWRSYADVMEGQSFDVRADALPGICRFCPILWIDNAQGSDPLLLLRCQYLPAGQ